MLDGFGTMRGRSQCALIALFMACHFAATSVQANWPVQLTTPGTANSFDFSTIYENSRNIGDQWIYLDKVTTTAPIDMYVRAVDGSDTPQKFEIPRPTSSWRIESWMPTSDPNRLFVTTRGGSNERYYWANLNDPTDVDLIDVVMPTGTYAIENIASTLEHGIVQRYYGSLDNYGLTSVSLNGGQPVDYFIPTHRHDVLNSYRLSPDGQSLSYFVRKNDEPYSRLYSSPLDGSTPPIELFNSGASVVYYNYQFSSDSSRVLFAPGDGVYSVPVAGGTPIRLSPALSPDATLTSFRAADDRVTFVANFAADGTRQLYSAPIDGSSPAVRLSGDTIGSGAVAGSAVVTKVNDTHYAIFAAAENDQLNIFARRYDGSGPVIPLGDNSVHGEYFGIFQTIDTKVFFLAETLDPDDNERELFVADIENPSNVIATGARIPKGIPGLPPLHISNDGKWATFPRFTDFPNHDVVMAVPTDGSLEPFEVISVPFQVSSPVGGNVDEMSWGALSDTTDVYIFTGKPTGTNGIAFYSVDFNPPTLLGDYNDDGIVNTADYIVWRKNVGAAPGTLPNDPYFRIIGEDQYSTWRANLGRTAFASDDSGSVPEPASLLFAFIGSFAIALARNQIRDR